MLVCICVYFVDLHEHKSSLLHNKIDITYRVHTANMTTNESVQYRKTACKSSQFPFKFASFLMLTATIWMLNIYWRICIRKYILLLLPLHKIVLFGSLNYVLYNELHWCFKMESLNTNGNIMFVLQYFIYLAFVANIVMCWV